MDTNISTPKQITFYKTYNNLGTTRNICDPDFMEHRWIKRYVNTEMANKQMAVNFSFKHCPCLKVVSTDIFLPSFA